MDMHTLSAQRLKADMHTHKHTHTHTLVGELLGPCGVNLGGVGLNKYVNLLREQRNSGRAGGSLNELEQKIGRFKIPQTCT